MPSTPRSISAVSVCSTLGHSVQIIFVLPVPVSLGFGVIKRVGPAIGNLLAEVWCVFNLELRMVLPDGLIELLCSQIVW